MNKSKVINNVSATTAVDLKAELAQHIEQFEKNRSTLGKQVQAQKPKAKPTIWSKQNKGVQDRNKRDEQKDLPAVEGDILMKSRRQLEKKAKMYEAMRTGQLIVDEEDDEKMPLIDFDRKYFQERELEQTKKESSRKKRRIMNEKDDDPWVEYEDEFGRNRIVRRSQLPKLAELSYNEDSEEEEEEINTAYAAYRPNYEAADRSDMNHYEADREIRTKGVGFYQFSKDEEERQEQMEKLKKLREETENARKSTASASTKRKQMLSENAEKIRARKAALNAKRRHQLKPEEVPKDVNIPAVMNEEIVIDFLKSVRKQMEQ
ncbi:uncharacterized protein BX663DRAFT_503282 [Cokeromyces recurvatus]|uniref:uncharacterized protein n=1 Tax=Cokeromyces recurvatus TaxID=90255 RepID=UPI00221FCA7F|nr:uncharacterized protein BX663DRAFT_503282 [Cokeromyces recurvatus]KAI7904720.1 hypothetical protein BX663DRAFT_503282 [Cokeromyces recurvatus]